MSRRIIEINSLYFDWPVGATRPLAYAIAPANLPGYFARTGVARVANAAESEAALAANCAGPNNKKLTADELVRCYRDEVGYGLFHKAAGVALLQDARN